MVVADHTNPILMSLRADSIELPYEQIGRRIVGGHADRDERPACILVASRIKSTLLVFAFRFNRNPCKSLDQFSSIIEGRLELQCDVGLFNACRNRRKTPKAAGVALAERIYGWTMCGPEISSRHAQGFERLIVFIDPQLQIRYCLGRVIAPARYE